MRRLKRLKRLKCVTAVFAAVTLFITMFSMKDVQAAPNTPKATGEDFIVMIDPGHGGSNVGGQVIGLDEKNATFITALALKEELEKYKGIKVYLTRYDDSELTLAQRPQLAAAVGADFFISLHYNKAVPNRLYGAEVWIPSTGSYFSDSYSMADLVLNELCDNYGLYRRGIKTKVTEKGIDYYGVIREASNLGIPSMIIEHCHLDNEVDVPYFNSPEKLQRFGKLDATAIAKYFHLKSDILGVDYSGIQETKIAVPIVPIIQDLTPPDTVSVRCISKDKTKAHLEITASDAQSPILYYDYSLDGGITWSNLYKWDCVGTKKEITLENVKDSVYIRAYNQYDLCSACSVKLN